MPRLPQAPIPPQTDLRDMLRAYLVRRSLQCMERAAERRKRAIRDGAAEAYREAITTAVRGFYGALPVGPDAEPVRARLVSAHDREGYRLENVLFDSFPGWEVNATVYVPRGFAPPYPAVVVPVGHSGKQFESYQLPCQFFACSGYLAVVFDPPGQASEKQPGNDHFTDGVRCYPVGETSSRYFVADALRCIDYLETREDADMSRGVAMTGVSGGGTTTTLAGLLDPRVTVLGPSCCVTALADLDISQCYAGCPETHMWRRYAEGIDEIDLICAAFPRPVLLMAGEQDEVFRIDDVRALAEEARLFYASAGMSECIRFFVDPGGHAYSLAQARQFVAFMDHWLAVGARPPCDLPDEAFFMDAYEDVRCYPRTDVNMRTLSVARARELREKRRPTAEDIRQAATQLAQVEDLEREPQAEAGEQFRLWTHYWQPVMLRPEAGIELPATFIRADSDKPAPTLIHFDDSGRHRLIGRNGPLMSAIRFIERDRPGANLLAVDLRGWGDTEPNLYPYEAAGWGGIDRYLAYTSAALGDSVLGMRIRDGLAALTFARREPSVDDARIVVSGCGAGAVVAMHVALIGAPLHGLAVWNRPESFEALVADEPQRWPQDLFVPNVLLSYDLPELLAALKCSVIDLAGTEDGARGELVPALTRLLFGSQY